MLIALGNGQIKWCKLKGANELLPNELNYEKRNTQVQVGGEGGADIRIVNCFVTVFLSFSLLAFTLAFSGFSAKERGQQRREMPERLRCELMCWESWSLLKKNKKTTLIDSNFFFSLLIEEPNNHSFNTAFCFIWLLSVIRTYIIILWERHQ